MTFIDQVNAWEWRDAQTLWFVGVPFVWWLVSTVIKRRQTTQYADRHLWPWVKADSQFNGSRAFKGAKNTSPQPGRFLFGLIGRLIQRLFSPGMMMSVAWIGLVIALAGPRTAIPAPEESTRAGVDVLMAVDVSRSMLAQDTPPNRFIFSKALIESLLHRLEPNDRVGLMAYAGKPHLVTPLTFDHKLFNHYLNLIRPGMLPTHGSQLPLAVSFGYQHLVQTAGKSRVLIVFTNGEPENYQSQPLPETLKKIAHSGTKVILVGVGETAASRVPDFNDRSGYLHANGILVTSRLEAVSMQKLAGQLGGQYLHASKDANFVQALLKAISLEAEKRHFQSSQPVWQDHAMPFIWTALLALLWAFFPLSRALQRKSNLVSAYWGAGFVLCFISTGSVLHSGTAVAAEPNVTKQRQAYDAFASKNYDLSQQLYDEMNDYRGWFGAGDAAYRAEDYESAVLYFRQAALMGRNDRQRAESLYNLGNTYYQTNLLDQAIEAYEQALVYQPDYQKAKHNLELAKQRRAVERKGQQQRDESGEGQGKGSQSRDADGSFYGGQKPNSDPGEGVSGESPEGNKQAKDFVLPSEMDQTDFRLKTMHRLQTNDTASAILDQQQRIRRIEKFEQKMERVDDNQSELLIRLFEREEGFQARQDEAHDLPGVKPW